MPEVWRMMNAIFSAVHSDAATIRSPSPSRSSSSVTTTSSPLAKACRISWIGSAIRVSRCAWRALTGVACPRQLHYAGQNGFRDVALRWRQGLQTCLRSEPTKNKGETALMTSATFDFTPLLPAGLPAPAAKWTGLAKYSFVGGNNDPDGVPVDGLVDAVGAVLRREGKTLATYGLA